MKTHTCDILIIGAGPAGCSAARAAAGAGARVMIIDRRHTIGVPVQCAEYIPAPLLKEVNLGRDYVVQATTGMRTILPDGTVREMSAPGYTIHRDQFDQALAADAVNLGTDILLEAAARKQDSGMVTIVRQGAEEQIVADIIIGADGPRSIVAKWCGAENQHLMAGAQVNAPLWEPLDQTEVYFDASIVGGYGWLFPKGKQANVGVGMLQGVHGQPGIKTVLNTFIERLVRDQKIKADPGRVIGGWIPAEPVKQTIFGNMLLVGDAAGQTHPITGAGIFPAVTCGKMAGKWAAKAAAAKDHSLLLEYESEWQDLFEHTLTRAWNRRQLLETNWADLDRVVRRCWVAFREYYANT